jgi:hypothetical protein
MKNRLSFLAGGFGAMVILWLLLGAAAPAPIQRNQFTTNIVGALVKGNVGFDSAVNVTGTENVGGIATFTNTVVGRSGANFTGAINVGDVSFFTNTVNIGNWQFRADGSGGYVFNVAANGDFLNDAFTFFDDGHATLGAGSYSAAALLTVNAVTINSIPIGSGLIVGPSGSTITNILAGSANLDFPSTLGQTHSDLSIAFTGVGTNDIVSIGVPVNAMQVAGCVYMGYPSNNTVWIRFLNSGVVAKDPGPGVFKVLVTKF